MDRSEIIAQQITSLKGIVEVQYGLKQNSPESLDTAHGIATCIAQLLLAEICEGETIDRRKEQTKAKEKDKEVADCVNCQAIKCSVHQPVYDRREPGQSIKNKIDVCNGCGCTEDRCICYPNPPPNET